MYYHNGGDGYANNYELSYIRRWLNDNFYNTAFANLEKEIIVNTNIDNGVLSTGYSSNSYSCSNTDDNVFLLSYSEATDSSYGFNNESSRQVQASAYARVQGLYSVSVDKEWWLRSPYANENAKNARLVYYDGTISGGNGGHFGDNYIGSSVYGTSGIRPACWIQL